MPQEGLTAWPDYGSALLPDTITSSKGRLQKIVVIPPLSYQ